MSEFFELTKQLHKFGELNRIQRLIIDATISGKSWVEIRFKSIKNPDGFITRWKKEGFAVMMVHDDPEDPQSKNCACTVIFDWSGKSEEQLVEDMEYVIE